MKKQLQTFTRRLQPQPLDSALLLLVGLFGLWSGWWASIIIADDAMITFRVAENLAYGRGFVYNVGERVQVTTTPLYTMVLAVGTWLAGSAPRAALMLNIALAGLIPMLAYDVGRRLSGRITGLSSGLLLALAPLLIIAFSMESYLYVALLLATLNAYAARRYAMAGVLAGLTALLRGDAVLMGASLLTYDFLVSRRLRWQMIIPAISLPALWYIFSTVYYGSPFPATLQAKTAQGEFNWLGEHFISGFIEEYWEEWLEDYGVWFYLFPLLYGLGAALVIWQERTWLVLLGRDLLYIATFEGLGVTFAEWYYAPLMPGVALLIGRGLQALTRGVAIALTAHRPRLQQPIAAGLAATLTLLLLWILYPASQEIVAAHPDWKARTYPDAARWIADNSHPDATLATIDIGHLGYWSGRRIIDIVGLAQPDVAQHIAQGDFGYAIRQYQPDMVLLGALWLPEVQSKSWFQQNYPARHTLRLPGMGEPLTLYTRQEGVKLQTQNIPQAAVTPLAVDFNRQIQLTGYHVNQPAAPGGMLTLTLFWEAVQPPTLDFTVFVQLVDGADKIVAQGDSRPQDGFYATSYWQADEEISDSYHIALPETLPPGRYNLLVGLYDTNGVRLQILDEAGNFAGDHVRLPDVEIESLKPSN